jgi:hypothetical protein
MTCNRSNAAAKLYFLQFHRLVVRSSEDVLVGAKAAACVVGRSGEARPYLVPLA